MRNIMRALTSVVLFVCLSVAMAQKDTGEAKPEEDRKIPATLTEAHAELERLLHPKMLAEIDAMESEDEMAKYHFSLGMAIRNRWGLWRGSPLAKQMQKMGFTHADDMSSVILKTFWCKRHKQDFRLQERAAHYKAYWEAARKSKEKEKNRVQEAQAAMKTMMMGLRYEEPKTIAVHLRNRNAQLRARFLARFRNGVFVAVRRLRDRVKGRRYRPFSAKF